jgi:hypothetical protein
VVQVCPPFLPDLYARIHFRHHQIMVRFPDGRRLQRRFNGDTASMTDVYDWVEAESVETGAFRCVFAVCFCRTRSLTLDRQTCASLSARRL